MNSYIVLNGILTDNGKADDDNTDSNIVWIFNGTTVLPCKLPTDLSSLTGCLLLSHIKHDKRLRLKS